MSIKKNIDEQYSGDEDRFFEENKEWFAYQQRETLRWSDLALSDKILPDLDQAGKSL